MGAGTQRAIALVVLLVVGILSLPLSAAVLDGQGTENWIIPAQLAGVAVVGAVVGYALPGLAGTGASRRRGAGVGVVAGIGGALVGVLLFLLLLNGFSGA